MKKICILIFLVVLVGLILLLLFVKTKNNNITILNNTRVPCKLIIVSERVNIKANRFYDTSILNILEGRLSYTSESNWGKSSFYFQVNDKNTYNLNLPIRPHGFININGNINFSGDNILLEYVVNGKGGNFSVSKSSVKW